MNVRLFPIDIQRICRRILLLERCLRDCHDIRGDVWESANWREDETNSKIDIYMFNVFVTNCFLEFPPEVDAGTELMDMDGDEGGQSIPEVLHESFRDIQ
ncbi:hypothetical protein ACOME3_000520 [Neoechinorhynchus agilis]